MQAYTTLEPGNPLGLLQEALELSESLEPLERKLRQARKEGLIKSEYRGHQIAEAEVAEVISASEARELQNYHQKVLALMSVDDFAANEIGRNTAKKKSPAQTAKGAAPKKTSKKAARKKPVKKKGRGKEAGITEPIHRLAAY